MGNLIWRHWHACPDCTQTWECFMPGGCREEKERSCSYCDGDKDDPEDEE